MPLVAFRCSKHECKVENLNPDSMGAGYVCWREGFALLFLEVTDGKVNVHVNHDGRQDGIPDIRCYIVPPQGGEWVEAEGYPRVRPDGDSE